MNNNQLLPNFKLDKESPKITFQAIPFWEGVQKKSGVKRQLPFSLTSSINSPIKQIASDHDLMSVVDAYKSDEYTFITPPPGASDWADSLGESYVNAVLNQTKDFFPKKILEIGGGSTWIAKKLIKSFKPDSYVLMDPSVRDAAKGVEVILDYFPSAAIDNQHFDLILGFNVLEHVPDPLSFLCEIRNKLTSNGKVILIYPDCEKQLLQGDINVLVHEHLSYFTKKSSYSLSVSAGFSVESISSENDTLMIVLKADPTASVSNQEFNETKLIEVCAESFRAVFINLADIIRKKLNNNELVGFHGATNGLNSFLFITGLGNHPNIRIYDGDVSKVGFYLPASTAQIQSNTDKSYADNSLLVISAMSYFNPIKQFAIKTANFESSQILPLAKI